MSAEIVHFMPRPKPMSDEDRKVVEAILFGPDQAIPTPTIEDVLVDTALACELISGQLADMAASLRALAKKVNR